MYRVIKVTKGLEFNAVTVLDKEPDDRYSWILDSFLVSRKLRKNNEFVVLLWSKDAETPKTQGDGPDNQPNLRTA